MSKKDLSVALIGLPHPGEVEEHDDDAHDDDAKSAMDELITAVHAKDTDAALKAFAVLYDLHAADDGEEDEPEG